MNKIFILLNIILFAFIITTYGLVHVIMFILAGQWSLLTMGLLLALGFAEIFFILFFVTLMYKAQRR
ncbi:MAG TPA: hypothetical protein VKU94_04200 [Geobacterales bacterium]|nr:hypothetical protein [Geobacterales bacterium]